MPQLALLQTPPVMGEDMSADHELKYYRYQAQVPTGGGDESHGKSAEGRDGGQSEQVDAHGAGSADIVVRQEWTVEHEEKDDEEC